MLEKEGRSLSQKVARAASALAVIGLCSQDMLSSTDKESLLKYGKILVYNVSSKPDGYGVSGYAGLVWDEQDQVYKICTISHAVNVPDTVMSEIFAPDSEEGDPVSCTDKYIPSNWPDGENVPRVSYEGAQVGDTVFMLNKEKELEFFTVSETEEREAWFSPEEQQSLIGRGDSGTLVYKKDVSGEVVAIGAHSKREIAPNPEDPEHPIITYNAVYFNRED